MNWAKFNRLDNIFTGFATTTFVQVSIQKKTWDTFFLLFSFFSGWKMEKVLTSSPKCFMAYSRTPDAASGCCSLLLMLKEMTKQWQTVRPIWTQNRGFQSFTVKHEGMQVLSKKKDKAKGHRLENMTWMYKSQSQEVPAKTSMLLNEANQHTTSH